jgi:hypothetical protein
MTFYVARRCTGLTLRQLGMSAGRVDDSAVGGSIRRFEQRLGTEKAIRTLVETILKEF